MHGDTVLLAVVVAMGSDGVVCEVRLRKLRL